MRIIINVSNINVGGGAQVSLSFIHYLKQFSQHQFYVFASEKVYSQINFEDLDENVQVLKVDFGLKHILLGKYKSILELEKKIDSDVVFTVFGPSYWTPKSAHLMGFALPWLINPETKAFKEFSFKDLIKKRLQNLIKGFFVKKNATHFVVETEDVKHRLLKYFSVPLDNTWVVDNTFNQYFNNVKVGNSKTEDFFRLITITANYPHKNLRIIKRVIPILIKRGLKVSFTLTIPESDFSDIFGSQTEYVKNIGPVASKDCPKYYNESDALFLPTLLECFTASYPEAMVMKRPILTSNLVFAKQICGEKNALFFDPLNPVDIANQIEKLVNNDTLFDELVSNGLNRVSEFLSSKQRAEAYIKILEEMHETKR